MYHALTTWYNWGQFISLFHDFVAADIEQKKLFELEEHEDQAIIFGTLFKNQNLKPSILKEISEEVFYNLHRFNSFYPVNASFYSIVICYSFH